MAIPNKLKQKYFYHFTHISNLESILKNGFLCTNEKMRLDIEHEDIANGNIQGRRHNMNVPIPPGGTVHDYIPFYFCTTNPMLLGVTNKKNIDQPFLIFFAIPIQRILEENVIFTDSSANTMMAPNFYSNAEDLDNLNWEAIDSRKWGSTEDERHQRMAEVLVYKEVPFHWISDIIVWNPDFSNEVKRILNEYKIKGINIHFQPFKDRYFYFTKFGVGVGRDRETLVTGPAFLKITFDKIVSEITKEKEKKENKCNFESVEELLSEIDKDFCSVDELYGIFELETINEIHHENVSDHVLNVVSHLENSECYKAFDKDDRDILKLSAYFHDVGKGPHEKWKDKKQHAYPDHPVDSLKMIKRVLIEEIKELSEYQIRMICLLVGYHDLIGEIFGKERDKKQLFNILKNEKEFDMLNCLSHADIKSFDNDWQWGYKIKIKRLKTEFLEQLKQ